MIQRLRHRPSLLRPGICAAALFAWFTVEAAVAAADDKASSSRSRSSSVSSKSSSSGSSARSSGSSSSSSSRRAVPRSGSSRGSDSVRAGSSRARGNNGAARTRSGRERVRPRRGRGHGSYGYGFGYGHGYGYGFRHGYWHPWGYWGWGWYGPSAPIVVSHRPGYGMGALDLKIRPKNAEVYIDGQYVGLARQYDGFPGYLWLEKGVYEVSFYKPGFATESRTVKVMTSLVLDVEIGLREGEAVLPEVRFSHPADDEAARDEGREIVERMERSRPATERARLHLTVEPASARVYLDGELLGTGEELAGLRAGLMLSPGEHVIEVENDGFETERREVVADAGEGVEMEFRLEPLVAAAR